MSSSPPTKTEPSNQAKSAMDGEHHSEVQAITNDNVGVAARDNLLKKEIVNDGTSATGNKPPIGLGKATSKLHSIRNSGGAIRSPARSTIKRAIPQDSTNEIKQLKGLITGSETKIKDAEARFKTEEGEHRKTKLALQEKTEELTAMSQQVATSQANEAKLVISFAALEEGYKKEIQTVRNGRTDAKKQLDLARQDLIKNNKSIVEAEQKVKDMKIAHQKTTTDFEQKIARIRKDSQVVMLELIHHLPFINKEDIMVAGEAVETKDVNLLPKHLAALVLEEAEGENLALRLSQSVQAVELSEGSVTTAIYHLGFVQALTSHSSADSLIDNTLDALVETGSVECARSFLIRLAQKEDTMDGMIHRIQSRCAMWHIDADIGTLLIEGIAEQTLALSEAAGWTGEKVDQYIIQPLNDMGIALEHRGQTEDV